MKIYAALIALLLALAIPAKSDLVDWGMLGGQVFTSSSFSTSATGINARFGTWGTSYDFTGKTFAQLNSDFTSWATEPIESGQFYGEGANTTGSNGTPWYVFIGDSSSQFGIFGNATWVNSGDPFLQFIDLSDNGTFAPTGLGIIGTGDNAGNVALVPEPSTYALLTLGGLALAGHVIRRRRRS